MTKAGVNGANTRSLIENPLKTNRRGLKVCHPILDILGAAEGNYGKFIATGPDGVDIQELLGQIDPVKLCETELSDDSLRLLWRAVGGVRNLREQQSVLRAETRGRRIESRHTRLQQSAFFLLSGDYPEISPQLQLLFLVFIW